MEENEKMNVETSSEEIVKTEEAPVEETPVVTETPAAEGQAPAEKTDEDGKPISRKKRILNGILLGVQIALVLFAIILTLIMILNPKQDEVSGVGIKLLPVLTDSMDGERTLVINEETGETKTFSGFPAGALVIAKNPDYDDLKVGDIVTFQDRIGDELRLNTHRIIEVVEIEPGLVKYRTQGDNPEKGVDSTLKLPGDIKAVYITHINGVGKALTWIRDGYNFIYVIIIPLGLLLIYNIYLVAQIVVESKMKKARAAAAEDAKQAALASIDEEEIKRKAIEEYLKQQAAAGADAPKSGEDK